MDYEIRAAWRWRRNAAGLLLDHAQRRTWADGHEIQPTYQEFELLAFFSTHPATVFSRAELVERIWHRDSPAIRGTAAPSTGSATSFAHHDQTRNTPCGTLAYSSRACSGVGETPSRR
jgi:hypothetical protein